MPDAGAADSLKPIAVSPPGNGNAKVTSTPAGISCGARCSGPFPPSTSSL